MTVGNEPKGWANFMAWVVYILKCSNNSYYVGHTENLEARLQLHSNGKGAQHTAKHHPVSLIYQESAGSKQSAIKRELQIKRWSRAKKEALANNNNQSLKRLSRCRSVHGKTA